MVQIFLVLTIVVTAVTAVPHGDQVHVYSREDVDNINFYDCSHRANGNYIHPSDCTKFISCSEGRAIEKVCPDCNRDVNVAMCRGNEWLVYDHSQNRCEWPATTQCKTDPESEVTLAPDTPTDAPDIPTDAPDTPTDDPDTPKDPETTDAPGGGDDEKETCGKWTVGDDCTKDDCDHCGWCKDTRSYYIRCHKTKPEDPKDEITGVIVREECDRNLWWDFTIIPEGKEYGGVCVPWSSLNETAQLIYKDDVNCVKPVCEWNQDEDKKCSAHYWLYEPLIHAKGEHQKFVCDGALLWDKKTETCRAKVDGC